MPAAPKCTVLVRPSGSVNTAFIFLSGLSDLVMVTLRGLDPDAVAFLGVLPGVGVRVRVCGRVFVFVFVFVFVRVGLFLVRDDGRGVFVDRLEKGMTGRYS